ncbi:MAG: hypothetical protein Pg6C_20080 [Treponemataceae bacterium]|nr:MAG: hypothetical protein Pg6C_20080 [Treponemataceae bacterium]
MSIIEFIKYFFAKRQIKNPEQLSLEQGLEKWELMKKADSAVIRGFATYSRFDDFAAALVYADKQRHSVIPNAKR